MDVSFTNYFETKVLAKPARKEVQEDGERVRFWAAVPELEGRFLRVITLSDERTTTTHSQTGDSNHEN